VNGEPFELSALSAISHNQSLGYYIRHAKWDQSEDAATVDTLELKVMRKMGDGLEENLALTKYSQKPLEVEFAIHIEADFVDQDEVSKPDPHQPGTLRIRWEQRSGRSSKLIFDYEAVQHYDHKGEKGLAEFHRGAEIEIESGSGEINYRNGAVRIRVSLFPQKSERIRVRLRPTYSFDEGIGPFGDRAKGRSSTELCEEHCEFGTTLVAQSGGALSAASAVRTISRATSDLAALHLKELDVRRGWVPAAGLPAYVGFFGRDVLIAGMHSLTFGSHILRGALEQLAMWQGTETNDWRDEQTGRMLHQAEIGPSAMLNYTPFRRYYGSITTPAVFSWGLGLLWRWTGNREDVTRFIEPGLRALRWLDQACRSECGGFYSYKSRSTKGLKNQAWKDSGDAFVDENGLQVVDPIAPCECQAYVYASKLHAAELLRQLGRQDEAELFVEQAEELKKRFNEAFWMPDLGFFAMGLDKDGRQIKSISSNPLHCLNADIIDDGLVRLTVDRLFQNDLYTGWGVRTLSSDHVAYNPYSYQRGTVWPFEQGALALALRRYRLYDRLERLARGVFEAAALFEHTRLPELFGGQPRDSEHPFPALYPKANCPQAWSASAILALIEALLGLQPDAPARQLKIAPRLPEYLPEVRLRKLRVGEANVDIAFRRDEQGRTDFVINEVTGILDVMRVD
jgi:glycogen debranching enzyme